MLLPKKTKFRRQFRRRVVKGKAWVGSELAFGEHGLRALTKGQISSRQLEAARRAIIHHTKRSGKMWIRIYPDTPVSKKPNETRMGKGKSPVDHYVAIIKPGRILFELSGISKDQARGALRRAAQRLPVRTKIIAEE